MASVSRATLEAGALPFPWQIATAPAVPDKLATGPPAGYTGFGESESLAGGVPMNEGGVAKGRPGSADETASATCGIRFGEVMRGYMGSAGEYGDGYAEGESAGRRVEFRVMIVIGDIDRFLDDPEHEASVGGEVDVAAIGARMPIEGGRFHLMCRREGRRRMLYHLPLRHKGQRYLLSGEKRIENDPGFDVWKDTTTLFAQLAEVGVDGVPIAPPLSKGILRISPLGVLRQLASFRTAGAGGPVAAARTYVRFVGFFLREVRATYGRFPW